ncbi:MAG: RIP metalloprotease RseP [Syntrophobacteraceae bacterium]
MITAIVSTVVVLGVLIFVHELGHFLVARRVGVTVERFSFGFGPKLFGVQRGDTEYRLSLIPLGGYVKMLGEDPEEGEDSKERPDSFSAQPVFKRMAIVLAGPMSNFALAIVIFALLYAFYGIPRLTPEIGSVTPDSPAERAGLQAGDMVLSLNGQPIKHWEELSEGIVNSGEALLTLGVQRGPETLTIKVKPEVNEIKNIFGESVKRPIIGIVASQKEEIEKVNPLYAGYYSLERTAYLSKLFLLTVVKLVERVLPMNTLGGPLLIAQMAGEQAREGLVNLIHFMAVISVNLAVLNLLPIPVLDGGHLLFFTIEAIRRKPIAVQKVEMAQKVGMFLLLVLMVFVFYNDIMRMIPGGKSGPLTP